MMTSASDRGKVSQKGEASCGAEPEFTEPELEQEKSNSAVKNNNNFLNFLIMISRQEKKNTDAQQALLTIPLTGKKVKTSVPAPLGTRKISLAKNPKISNNNGRKLFLY